MSNLIPVIAVVGPTAVGKTNISISLAKYFKSEIISCDSVQIYKYLNIGSAKPLENEKDNIPYYLIDIFDPDFQIDVGIYKKLAEEKILYIYYNQKVPIICGGTGLYFNSLYYGLFEAPARNKDIRDQLEQDYNKYGLSFLYNKLKDIDPIAYSKIKPNDKRRIIRALEVYYITGKNITSLQENNKKLPIFWILIGLNRDRNELYKIIEKRIDLMLENGLIEETKEIINKFGINAYALSSIGYRHVIKFLNGEWDYNTMIYELKKDTRHYAKRQITWFKKIKEIVWFNPDNFEDIIKYCEIKLNEFKKYTNQN